MKYVWSIVFLAWFFQTEAQHSLPLVENLQIRLDSIQQFEAQIGLEVDISFVRMPPKTARMTYQKGKESVFTSSDFVMLPKKGMDVTFQELFRYPFIAVDRGLTEPETSGVRHVNIIPNSPKADFALADVFIDEKNLQVQRVIINTKDNGSFDLACTYENPDDFLPHRVVVSFEVEKVRIPLNFMGKDSEIDRKLMREEGDKKGRIFMDIDVRTLKLTP